MNNDTVQGQDSPEKNQRAKERRGLGYPLHPMLVHFPIALFVISLLLDIAGWVGLLERSAAPAFYSMALGVATALLAAIPGVIDYSDIRLDNPAKRLAFYHMLLNLTVVAIYAVNLGLRFPNMDVARSSLIPFCLSIAGVVLLSISGYLGGEMVFEHGIGVGRHRRDTPTPEQTLVVKGGETADLVPVAREDALPEGGTLRAEVQGQAICIAKSEGRLYAVQEFCTHRYGPLSEGAVCQNRIECPWHRSVFDLSNGKVIQGPAKVELKTYRVEVRRGEICVSPQPMASHGEAHDLAA